MNPKDIEHAIHNPPADTPAFLRSALMKEFTESGERVEIDWNSIRVGPRFRAKVIRLRDYRG